MKKFLSVFLSLNFIFSTVAVTISAQSTSVTVLCEPFEEKRAITATESPDYWSAGDSLASRIINTKGETVFEMIAIGAKQLNNNVFLLKMPAQLNSNQEKLVDFTGKKITDKKFNIVEPINNNALIVKIDGKTGIFDFIKDEMLVEAEYTSYRLRKNTAGDVVLILLNKGEKSWDIIDMRTLEKRTLPDSLSYSFLSEKYLEFIGDKQGIADIYGNIKYLSTNDKYVRYINDNIVTITDNTAKNISVCDMEGNVKNTFSTENGSVSPISIAENGTFYGLSYKTTGVESRLWGVKRIDGTILTEESYYYVTSYPGAEVVAVTDFGGKGKIIDYYGNVVIPEGKYTQFTYPAENLYICYLGNEYKYELVRIEGTKAEVLGQYQNIRKLNGKYFSATKDNKVGVINYSGEVIVPFKYKSVEVLGEFLFTVINDNNKKGVADYYGNEIIECKYSAVTASGAGRYDTETIMLKDADTNRCTFVRVDNSVVPDISVKVGGVSLDFDQIPVIEGGRTLVPLRAIFEALGASVSWNGETRCVTAVKGDITLSLTIDSDIITVNGKEEKLDVPAKIIGGRTLVPARAVSQALGYNVSWDGEARVITISK